MLSEHYRAREANEQGQDTHKSFSHCVVSFLEKGSKETLQFICIQSNSQQPKNKNRSGVVAFSLFQFPGGVRVTILALLDYICHLNVTANLILGLFFRQCRCHRPSMREHTLKPAVLPYRVSYCKSNAYSKSKISVFVSKKTEVNRESEPYTLM